MNCHFRGTRMQFSTHTWREREEDGKTSLNVGEAKLLTRKISLKCLQWVAPGRHEARNPQDLACGWFDGTAVCRALHHRISSPQPPNARWHYLVGDNQRINLFLSGFEVSTTLHIPTVSLYSSLMIQSIFKKTTASTTTTKTFWGSDDPNGYRMNFANLQFPSHFLLLSLSHSHSVNLLLLCFLF
jgi:hypothetical protein